jgi:hypothetical protein
MGFLCPYPVITPHFMHHTAIASIIMPANICAKCPTQDNYPTQATKYFNSFISQSK